MKTFIRDLFRDQNDINEKSVVGFMAFFMMIVTLITDLIMGIQGKELPIGEFVFDGFLFITLGAFGIASIDKWINRKTEVEIHNTGSSSDTSQ
jgi:ABC-type uncharacterized transport system permease subunit